MSTPFVQSRSAKGALLATLSFLASATLSACSHSTPPTAVAPPRAVPSIAGNWTGTQKYMTDVNKAPFQFVGQFLPDGTFTLSGNWQGMNGPAGQAMAGTYTQAGTKLTLDITHNQATAAGQTITMQGYTATGTVTPDGKTIDIGQTVEYVLTKS